MPDAKNKLYLYETLELRAEYDARIQTLKDCLPESRKNHSRFSFTREEESRLRPSPDFDLAEVRKDLRNLENKRRTLNSAIQKANFATQVELDGQTLNLNEALELRKAMNERIGELHTQVVDSAYRRVIYKEDRDIVEPNDIPFTESRRLLDEARKSFRELNRAIRKASFSTVVDFQDEK